MVQKKKQLNKNKPQKISFNVANAKRIKEEKTSKKKPIKPVNKLPEIAVFGEDKSHKSHNKKIDSLGRDYSSVAERIAKDKALVLKELEKTFGIVTTAIAKAKISNNTFYNWTRDDKEFARAVEKIQDGFDVIVEDKIKQKIIQNDGHMLRFYASHRIKKFKPKLGVGFDEEAEPIRMILTEYDPKYKNGNPDEGLKE